MPDNSCTTVPRRNTTSTSSPSTPEWSVAGARKSLRGLIPLRRRRLRLNAYARRPNPRSTRTKPTTYVRRPGTRSLGHLPTALKPSEAEETAVPGGGDEIGFSPLSLSLSTVAERGGSRERRRPPAGDAAVGSTRGARKWIAWRSWAGPGDGCGFPQLK